MFCLSLHYFSWSLSCLVFSVLRLPRACSTPHPDGHGVPWHGAGCHVMLGTQALKPEGLLCHPACLAYLRLGGRVTWDKSLVLFSPGKGGESFTNAAGSWEGAMQSLPLPRSPSGLPGAPGAVGSARHTCRRPLTSVRLSPTWLHFPALLFLSLRGSGSVAAGLQRGGRP